LSVAKRIGVRTIAAPGDYIAVPVHSQIGRLDKLVQLRAVLSRHLIWQCRRGVRLGARCSALSILQSLQLSTAPI